MDVFVEDTLDLSEYRSIGKKTDEVLLPEGIEEPAASVLPDYNKDVANQVYLYILIFK